MHVHAETPQIIDRGALAKMVMQLMDHWDLPTEDQLALLGLASSNRSALGRYRQGEPISQNVDQYARVGHLLGIHKNLRILFPRNKDYLYSWMIGEAEVQAALNSASKDWTGFDAPQIFKVAPKLRIKVNEKSFKSFEADAVILFQGDASAPVEFFEIDIKSHNDLNIPYDSLLKKAPYFDRQWVAFHKFNKQVGLVGIPEYVGALLLDGGEFKVLRKAQHGPLAGTKSLETAKLLLTKFLKG